MPREARAAGNEQILREVNQRIRDLEQSLGTDRGYTASFVCECARLGCVGPIVATIEEYETAREQPNQFLVLPDHVDPELERVVRRTDRFAVVEKLHGEDF